MYAKETLFFMDTGLFYNNYVYVYNNYVYVTITVARLFGSQRI